MNCSNCYETDTPQWRKINEKLYCNACGCHYKRCGTHKNIEEIAAKILVSLSKSQVSFLNLLL